VGHDAGALIAEAGAGTVFRASCAVLLVIFLLSPCARAQSLFLPTSQATWTPPVQFADAQTPGESQEKQTSSDAQKNSTKHMFWVVPSFNVTNQEKFEPLTPRGKFGEWLSGSYDPRGFGLYAFESATLERSGADGFCGYGKGWSGYGKCYGATELDANISSFSGDFLFPVILRQDPRYFRMGRGSLGKRLLYSISRVFVTHSDSGHWTFDSSALAGTCLGAAASNLYYPKQDRDFSDSVNRAGLDLVNTALFNVAAEFWPDIRRKLGQLF